jgi:phosphoribosylanthranilate isomerase
VKICGVTNSADAVHAAHAGADAIGLNFYPQTPRYLEPTAAVGIRRDLPTHLVCVGVFVNGAMAEIAEIVAAVGLDAVQLHGDESPEFVAELRGKLSTLGQIPLIRAFRCRENNYQQIAAYLDECQRRGGPIDAVLIDAFVEGKYGGGGASIDWNAFRAARPLFGETPLILAGGLTPENVETAILASAPDGVDVASGVETAPGMKDHQAVERFIAAARRAWNDANSRQ